MTPEQLSERIKESFRDPCAWGTYTKNDENKIKQVISDVIESIVPTKYMTIDSDLSEQPKECGYNNAIDTIRKNADKLLGGKHE